MNICEYPERAGCYRFVRVIARGSSAVVCLAVNEKTNEDVAIKVFKRKELSNDSNLKYLESELRIAERLHHPSLPKIYQILYEENFIMIVMEYLSNGNMIEALNKFNYFNYKEKVDICYKVIQGLDYLHDRGIAHRDIKLENICLDSENNPKIVDFGYSISKIQIGRTLCGTPVYMAPEVMRSPKYNAFKADIWSLGITLHLMLTRQFPFAYSGEAAYFKDIKMNRLKYQIYAGGTVGEIISRCLELDPLKRPTTKEILKMMDNLYEEEFRRLSTDFLPKLKIPENRIRENKYDLIKSNHGRILANTCVNFKIRRVLSY